MQNIRLDNLKLYHFHACPYCARTRRAIDELGLDIELRDIRLDPAYRKELVTGGGKTQVPSLRIESADGAVEWLYESQDIIQYLGEYRRAVA